MATNDKPSSLRTKLSGMPGLGGATPKTGTRTATPDRYRRLADAVGGELIDHPAGLVCRVRYDHKLTEPLGHVVLPGNWNDDHVEPFGLLAPPPRDNTSPIPVDSFCFFDTETTGLGGAGTVAFLLGVGRITPTSVSVDQFLLPDYPDEMALLECVAAEITDTTTIVSYNGAAFDLPLVTDRLRIHRVARELSFGLHIDLLPAVRRLWKRRLGDCSLGNVERSILGFERIDDLPGYLAPLAYFEWLQAEGTDSLAEVLLHNRWDIVSLAFLLYHLSHVVSEQGAALREETDLSALARLHERCHDYETADAVLSRIDIPQERTTSWQQAMVLKRRGRLADARPIWEMLAVGTDQLAVKAALELAKAAEHKWRDLSAAMQWTDRALALTEGPQERLLHRRARLLRKRDSTG